MRRHASLLAAFVLLTLPMARAAAAPEPPLDQLRGDVTVLAFWASWCPPCADELPKLDALARRYAGDAHVRVAAVSVDEPETRAGAEAQFAEAGLALPLVREGAPLLTLLLPHVRTPTLPLILVIDRADRGYWRAGAHERSSAAALAREVAAVVTRLRSGGGPAPRGWTRLGR